MVLGFAVTVTTGCDPKYRGKSNVQPPAPNQQSNTQENQDPTVASGFQESGEPDFITVQHILIGFDGSLEGKSILRTKSEAQAFAEKIFAKAKGGEDFTKLVEEHTDDSPPGIYKMANYGKPGNMSGSDQSKYVFDRGGMVPAFGNVGFRLNPGEIGMAPHHEKDSPYGWHIIKRLK